MKIKIIYIVDGGNKIGMGHVYQSISFAAVLKHSAEITFLTQSDSTVINIISSAGFLTHKMADKQSILRFIQSNKPNIVIFDKIDVDEDLARDIKEIKGVKLVIFTNITNANKYADIAVTADYGSNFKNIRYFDENTQTLYFYGPKYWIFKKEFLKFKDKKKDLTGEVKSILLTFGGSDHANLTTCAVRELLSKLRNFKITVILGACFSHTDELNQVLAEYKAKSNQVQILKDVSNIAELMHKADLVLASPGLSGFEALYVGTPILLMPQDELQKETYQGFFKIIDKDNVGILPEYIENREFIYPDQEDIVLMDIAGGTGELVEEILGGAK